MTNSRKTTEPSCMDEFDPNSLTVDEALVRINQSINPKVESENVALADCLNRVLANDVLSTMNVPPYTNSAMDGYALKGEDLPREGEKSFHIEATVFAGAPLDHPISGNHCARIMTGAKMPDGTDTVIMQEHVRIEETTNTIVVDSSHKSGQNVRQAGEDVKENDVVLNKGIRLGAAQIGLLASLGIAHVNVQHQLTIACFSTGDELTSLGKKLEPGQIYDSNRYTLLAMLKRFGANIIDLGVIKDKRDDIEQAFKEAANKADVLITTGGVSVGDADYVKETLEKLGTINFWKIAMKPGRPLAFGKLNDCHFFGLPGNPVSTMVTFYQFVLPAIKKLQGEPAAENITLPLRCTTPMRKNPGRVEYQRGIITRDNNGELVVQSTGGQGSHMMTSMAKANCFIILPMDCNNVETGDIVEVQPFSGII